MSENETAVDGPVYNAGRQEGQSDIAVRLRKIVDPSDANHWNVDACLAEVERLLDQLAAAQKTITANKRAMQMALDNMIDQCDTSQNDMKVRDALTAALASTGDGGAE